MEISVDKLMEALPIIGIGYLGIFAVTAVIIVLVVALGALTSSKHSDK